MIATAPPILRWSPLAVVSTLNGNECSIDTILGMTNRGTAVIRMSATADRAAAPNAPASETTTAACSRATWICPAGPSARLCANASAHELNGREGEALATIAAFRVLQVSDVQEILGEERGERLAQKSVDHLQASGLLERIPLERRDDDVVVPTDRGRDLLEANRREHADEPQQAFYAGLARRHAGLERAMRALSPSLVTF